MTEVEVTPPAIAQQNTHPIHPSSPKKRSFDEINGVEEIRPERDIPAHTAGPNPHPAPLCSSKKRPFDEINGLEEPKPGFEHAAPAETQAGTSSVHCTTESPGPAATVSIAAQNEQNPPAPAPTTCTPALQQNTSAPDGHDSITSSINPPIPPLQQSQPALNMAISQPGPQTVQASNGIDQPQLPPTTSQTVSAAASVPTAAPSAPSPKKKVKLTPAEKEAKEKQKAEEKARKEEEKRIKEEEKKKREEEREEKRKQREAEREKKQKLKEEERQAKEEEKRKKEDEKEKKERSQMRLNAFFTKPAIPENQSGSVAPNSPGKKDGPDHATNDRPPLSDYEKEFQSFFLQSHVKLAPLHRFGRDTDGLNHVRQKLDKSLKDGESDGSGTFKPTETFHIMPYKRRQGRLKRPTVKEIMASMQDSSLSYIDLTGDEGAIKHTTRLDDILKEIPMKTLKFGEDVRPPYQGTFTKPFPEGEAVKLSRNPFLRAIGALNYDYDSEAEWEEPEEGEDISTEGEDDASEDGDDDMDDFLDDAGDQVKRKTIVGDLEPICSGIRWDDGNGTDNTLKDFKMEVISETLSFPLDPFSDTYWKKPVAQSNNSPFKVPNHPADNSNSQSIKWKPFQQIFLPQTSSSSVPRPADPIPITAAGSLNNSGGQTQKSSVSFPSDQLSEFKSVVSDSDLTKAGLIEVLKKRFPKVSKGVIRDTLNAVAVRRGQKEVDKKWVLV